MKSIHKFIADHPNFFLVMYIAKFALSILAFILVVILMLTCFNPFTTLGKISEANAAYERNQQIIDSTVDYMNGVSEDTTNVPDGIVDSVENYREAEARIDSVRDGMRDWNSYLEERFSN